MTLLETFTSMSDPPLPGDHERAASGFEGWAEQASGLEDAGLAAFAKDLAADPAGHKFLEAIFANSPFLTRCLLSEIGILREALNDSLDQVVSHVLDGLKGQVRAPGDRASVMSMLRRAKRQVALLSALGDITGQWQLEQVTAALSGLADASLDLAIAHLLREAANRGEFAIADGEDPLDGSGFVAIAVGKLGAFELNYSSDIDLIALFDPERADYRGKRSPGDAFVRLTRELVTLLTEQTRDGYVFRTDLRLRPDPGATPIAISLNAALTYYESMGQNWERAAMIKARAAGGDRALGRAFLRELRPFVWRRHLDFWAIQDIHSIKRQINAHKGGARIAVAGHNIKLGRGGIREIEFFAQTQQLIFGGRDPSLRSAQTLSALQQLAESGRIETAAAGALGEAYRFLRRVEHRLQMIDDQQTHSLPASPEGLRSLANFLGYPSGEAFGAATAKHMGRVEEIYAELFEEAPALAGPGNLVFTGGEAEPGTLETLSELGYQDGEAVFNLVRSWHHGRHRATRSTRSRELLTELMPSLLEAFGKTRNPDSGLLRFNEFLSNLPAGIQIFSLIHANPTLLDLLAEIMGRAPALASHLGRNSGLLESVLSPEFFAPTPNADQLLSELQTVLGEARDFQDHLDLSRRWANDRRFQVGVQMLRHTADIDEAGSALSNIAEAAVRGLYQPVLDELARRHGRLPGPGLAVLALGKLGCREMTVTSDLDLIFIYETDPDARPSDGDKPLDASHYHARFAQRLINALTAPTGEGRLYEVDMRLRPSGNSGPIAVSLPGFERYQSEEAWTWEHMALTRARVICGVPDLAERILRSVRAILSTARDPERLLADVADMRRRITKERPGRGFWDVKDQPGGLLDLDFIAQFLLLRHAHAEPALLEAPPGDLIGRLGEIGALAPQASEDLDRAGRRMRAVQGFLRLTVGQEFEEESAPEGLKGALARAAEAEDFSALKESLSADYALVRGIFTELIEGPADALREGLDAEAEEDR